MPHEFHYLDPDRTCVQIRHFGVVTIEEVEEVVVYLEQQHEASALHGMLVDVRDAEDGPDKAQYLLWVRERPTLPYMSKRLAVLSSPGSAMAETMEFMVLAAQNRGVAAWDFTDEAEAIRWLTRPEDFA